MSSASAYRASGERTSPLQRGSVRGGSGGHKAGGKGRWVPGYLRAGSPGTGSRRRLSPRLEPPRAGMGVKGEVWTVELGHALQFRPGWPEHIANEACGVRVTGPVPGAPRGAPFLALGGREGRGRPTAGGVTGGLGPWGEVRRAEAPRAEAPPGSPGILRSE